MCKPMLMCCVDVVVWGFKLVVDPFVHVHEYMRVVVWLVACLSVLGEVVHENSRILPKWQIQVRPPKEGSDAEHAKEVVSAA